jgi:hypothetical protein
MQHERELRRVRIGAMRNSGSITTDVMDRQRVIDKLRGLELRTSSRLYKIGRELGRGGNGGCCMYSARH